MAIHLSSPVCDLPGLGNKAVADLKSLDITSVRDFLWYVPFRYDDFSRVVGAGKARAGDTVTVIGTIQSIQSRPAKNRHLKIVDAVVSDETGELKVVWFNQAYLEKTLPVGSNVSLAGRVDGRYGRCLTNPVIERAGEQTHTGRIVPVYGLTGSLTMRRLRDAMRAALPAAAEFPDWLPSHVVEHESYPSLAQALRGVHFPESQRELDEAVQRLKFDELFLHQLMFARVRVDRERKAATVIPMDEVFLKAFVASLPFELTTAQRKAIWEVVQDLEKSHPMNRLLEGDVGSGKTVVAAAAAASVLHGGSRVVYLAPTEILATQQHVALSKFLKEPVGLLTRTMCKIGDKDVSRDELIESLQLVTTPSPSLKRRGTGCVVGTHALLQDRLKLSDFRLVIVDEQHRFGVEQRHALLHTDEGAAPHLLSMSATPIPRTLALTIFGDLELSILNEMPPGRKPVATAVVLEPQQAGMWKHVREQIEMGRQVFVVCPLIDPSDKLGVKSVAEVARELKKGTLKDAKIETLHGRLKTDEKEKAIEKFRTGKIDVLVSTTVVEVGVDIPNASVMVIVGAERFGLAQLHQLRGRVGRSDIQSYCYLLPEQLSGTSEARLRAMEETTDGFRLAQIDLDLRGAGNVFGNAQSGFADFQLATPADTDLMKKARDYATELLIQDPDLDGHPLIHERIERQFEMVHLE
ncbi:MAG TPA: ATP-dependent DNA helicase RecG [Patescibacteria group bacterium]|nr:ATP-dependent DNA helicase RecG [Patescibacteria group bacterium]